MNSKICLAFLLFFFTSCHENVPASSQPEPGAHNADTTSASAMAPFKKYQVKSGFIVFETKWHTLTINMEYKTVIYFDDYA